MSSFMDVPGVKANELDATVAAKAADGTSTLGAQLNATYAPASGSANYDAAGDALVYAIIFGRN